MTLKEAIQKLPKTDLHCHLDGSMRAETILDIAQKEKIDVGTTNLKELNKSLLCGKKVTSLEQFLKAFDITCAVLQSTWAIERIAFELVEDSARDNIRVLEARFAPILCTQKGLSIREVARAAIRGLKKGEEAFSVKTGLIVCALRNLDPKHSIAAAELAAECKSEGVVGFDLAQAEKGNPPGKHAKAYQIAKEAGLGLTVHAGEDDAPNRIREAIKLCFAQRIGHGRTLLQDPTLAEEVKRLHVGIESCPSSNVQINLVPSWRDHPFRKYVERGILATLNTDNRLLTGITVTDEYLRAAEYLGMTWEELKTVALNGFRSAFLPKAEREKLFDKMKTEIDSISFGS